MQNVVYLLFRRMRMPLVVLICTYAMSVLGFVLIPGADAQGRPWHMDFFHAFYFVSFMGSTIGFGELPYPFTGGQRLWTMISIYATVVAWLYAIGAVLSMLQDPAFRRLVRFSAFTRAVRRITEPFYLVCGYGDTGGMVVRALAERGMRTVVIDINQERIDGLEVADYRINVPGLCADATDIDALTAAGMTRPCCAGVLALTNFDQVNVTVAITAKLMAPSLTVISRAEYQDTMANLDSFGTDHIVNPFETFANRFAMAIHSPSMHLLYEWMTSTAHTVSMQLLEPPRGTWVLCGYGRMGKALHRYLAFEGVRTVVVEADPAATGAPEDGIIHGRGTEAVTLREAKVEDAVGIIAGTDDDANNLSIVVTAREMNPSLFTVARQMHRRNDALFDAARLSLTMQPGTIMARHILAFITTPLLGSFLRLARHRDNEWANLLISRISGLIADEVPDTWSLRVDADEMPAVFESLAEGVPVSLQVLCANPRERIAALPCLALLLVRGDDEMLLPETGTQLERGDRLLFCGRREAARAMLWAARNRNVLGYLRDGIDRPTGTVWRWLAGEGEQTRTSG
jgi:voltage-gated potassium channel